MKLWIGNIAPGTSDEELIAFVKKYAPELECAGVQRVDGDGSRPAAALDFPAAPPGSLEKVSMRLDGMFWKERKLLVQSILR